MPQPITVSHHAITRADERLQLRPGPAAALLRRAWKEGVRIPNRYYRHISTQAAVADRPYVKRHKRGVYARVYGDVVVVGRGRRVITTWTLPTERFASLLCWVLFGTWA